MILQGTKQCIPFHEPKCHLDTYKGCIKTKFIDMGCITTNPVHEREDTTMWHHPALYII